MKSKLSYNKFSHITFGYLNKMGYVCGFSGFVSMVIEGNVDTEFENVVVDFGKGRDIVDKDILHSREFGIDHKLIITNYNIDTTIELDKNNINNSIIKTLSMSFNIPNDSFKLLNNFNSDYNLSNINDVESMVKKHINYMLNNFGCNFKVIDLSISQEPMLSDKYDNDYVQFSYTHSLKNSSHYGCRSIHGHTSVIAHTKIKNPTNKSLLKEIITDIIKNNWDNKTYVFDDNLELADTSEPNRYKYLYNDRDNRYIEVSVNRSGQFKHLLTETTCEYLTEHIANDVVKLLINDYSKTKALEFIDVSLYVSEGLQKGCEICLGDIIKKHL